MATFLLFAFSKKFRKKLCPIQKIVKKKYFKNNENRAFFKENDSRMHFCAYFINNFKGTKKIVLFVKIAT